jgi:hypothetical protein
MPVQIDHFETSIDIAPPSSTTTPSESSAKPSPSPSAEDLRAMMKRVFAEEMDSYSRMRGH